MKKILFFDFNIHRLLQNESYLAGGSSIQVYSWLKGLEKYSLRIGILKYKNESKKIDSQYDEINIFDESKGIRKIRWFYYRFPILLYSILMYRPDVIYQSCYGKNTFFAALISKLIGAKFIYRVANDIEADIRIKNKLSNFDFFVYKLGIKLASKVICQNEYQLEGFKKEYSVENIDIIHNPFFITQSSDYGFMEKSNYISWIGIFQYQKNLPGLLKVVKKLPQYKFKIAGKSSKGGLDDDTKHALSKLKKQKNVEFVGFLSRKDIKEFLNKSILLINTSFYEGFSNTYLESLSVGTPVISTKKTDPDSIIKDNNLGDVSEDISQMHVVIDNFIKSKYNETYKDRCKKYVSENHSPYKLAYKLLDSIKLYD